MKVKIGDLKKGDIFHYGTREYIVENPNAEYKGERVVATNYFNIRIWPDTEVEVSPLYHLTKLLQECT